jgi:hypothetical protein
MVITIAIALLLLAAVGDSSLYDPHLPTEGHARVFYKLQIKPPWNEFKRLSVMEIEFYPYFEPLIEYQKK